MTVVYLRGGERIGWSCENENSLSNYPGVKCERCGEGPTAQRTEAEKERATRWRTDLLCACALALLTLWGVARAPIPDIAQDYAAAWAVLHDRSASDPTDELLIAAGWEWHRAEPYRGTRQPHPPLATLLSLPLAAMPFAAARFSWAVLSLGCIVAAWRLGGVEPATRAASVPLWTLALALGTHEPLVFLALAAALALAAPDDRLPWVAGACLGFATALKVYPALALVLLAWLGRWREFAVAVVVAAALVAVSELLLGVGTTQAWLAYTGVNAERYVDLARNLSMVQGVRVLWPGAPPMAVALGMLVALGWPLARRARARAGTAAAGDGLRAAIPVMLLASPLAWRHYLGLLCLTRPRWPENLALGVAGAGALVFGLGLIPAPRRLLIDAPLFVVLLTRWHALVVAR
jgi:hypothetical protein